MKIKKQKNINAFQPIRVNNYTIKTPTPFNVMRYLKHNKSINYDADISYLKHMKKEYSKWKKRSRGIKRYHKSYRTRIKNQLLKYQTISKTLLERFNTPTKQHLIHVDMYQEMYGMDPLSWSDTLRNKWRSFVDYYFDGNEAAAMENFDYNKRRHER